MEDETHDLINAERRSDGKGDLVHNEDLRVLARAHSEDMRDRGFFDHENPDGEDPFERMAAAGIRYRRAGENILRTSRSSPATSAVTGWMNSAGHRANILNGDFTYAGMGVATNGTGTFWFTQVFTKPVSSQVVIVSWSENSMADEFGSSWSSLGSN